MFVSVAIDGPAGAGKSTVAKIVADRLGYLYVDTGAMYRALTWKVLQEGLPFTEEEEIVRLAHDTDIELKYDERQQLRVFCDGRDVTREIRQHQVSQNVSQVARIPGVRRRMVELQRQLARTRSVVMDGRDIGSYVLPDARHKFFLTASLDERVRRRCQQLDEQNIPFDPEAIKKEIKERDEMDRSRAVAPLVKAPDARLIDTTCQTIDQVVEEIITVIRGE